MGTILEANLNEKAIKPAYTLKIDLGPEGIKSSSAQITENYTVDALIGQQVVVVNNFEPRRVAGVKSEVLVLAAVCEKNGTVLLEPERLVLNGINVL